MIEGALILIVGWLVGHVTGYIQGRRLRPQKPYVIQPICGCGHHLSYHDETGCAANHEVATHWDVFGEPRKWDLAPCTCRKYVLKDDPYAGALGP